MTNPVIYKTDLVIYRTNPTIVKTNQVIFRTKPVILGTNQEAEDQSTRDKGRVKNWLQIFP